MTYLPVYCEACAHASLSEQRREGGEPPSVICSFCEQPARVIPGPVYTDGDWLAFAELDAAVYAAELDGARAMALVEQLQALEDDGATSIAVIDAMIARLPELQNVRPALVNRLPRGLRMLKTLLVGRARDLPVESGPRSTPIVGVRSPERRGHGS